MCQVYAKTDPILYESRSRSIRIHGVITGIRLENLFWQILSSMAESEGMTTNQLIVKLHEEVGEHRGEVNNFTSFLRVTCLRYESLRAESAVGASPPLASSAVDISAGDSQSTTLAQPVASVAPKLRTPGAHPAPQLVAMRARPDSSRSPQPSTLRDR